MTHLTVMESVHRLHDTLQDPMSSYEFFDLVLSDV